MIAIASITVFSIINMPLAKLSIEDDSNFGLVGFMTMVFVTIIGMVAVAKGTSPKEIYGLAVMTIIPINIEIHYKLMVVLLYYLLFEEKNKRLVYGLFLTIFLNYINFKGVMQISQISNINLAVILFGLVFEIKKTKIETNEIQAIIKIITITYLLVQGQVSSIQEFFVYGAYGILLFTAYRNSTYRFELAFLSFSISSICFEKEAMLLSIFISLCCVVKLLLMDINFVKISDKVLSRIRYTNIIFYLMCMSLIFYIYTREAYVILPLVGLLILSLNNHIKMVGSGKLLTTLDVVIVLFAPVLFIYYGVSLWN